MTRLKTCDISEISSCLAEYDRQLQSVTGRSLLGIAAHAWDVYEAELNHQIKTFSIHVIPVTAGQGIITDFSETVCAVLKFLGFEARITDQPDTCGLASAFEKKADAVMMADDYRFVGINLHTREVVDNSEATSRVFVAALDLMAGGIKNHPVLVMGCGPVGEAGAKSLLRLGATVALHDIDLKAAILLKEKLAHDLKDSRIQVIEDLGSQFSGCPYILEATPSENTIPYELISDHMLVAAPGVPLGISKNGCNMLENRLVHDKLELGVAAMAIKLVLNHN